MKAVKIASLVLAGAVTLTACSDEAATPLSPSPTPSAPSFSSAAVETSDTRIIVFSSSTVPSDFAVSVRELGGSIIASYDGIGVATVSGLSDHAAAELQLRDDISSIEQDEVYQILEPVGAESPELAESMFESQANPAAARFYPRQWHLRAIGAEKAWAAGKLGDASVTVAILDTGIGYTHADLAGLVDLSRSRSFVPSDDRIVAAVFPGAHPAADLHYHGTHVAATSSATGSRPRG